MNKVKEYVCNDQKIGFYDRQTEISEKDSKTTLGGGVTSEVLRYPHLIRELIEIKKREIERTDTNLLILGPGLSAIEKISSPHLHEVLAAFSKKARVTVVDNDDDLILRIGKSVFSSNERYLAESLLTSYDGHSVNKYDETTINSIRSYIGEIPRTATQHIEIQKRDFAEFEVAGKYDYIFATQSLMYPLLSLQSAKSIEAIEAKKKSQLIIAKYLGALNDNGTLVVDEILYNLIQKNFEFLPNPKDFKEAAIRWEYKTKKSSVPFTARKIEVPNDTRKVEKTPKVFYIDRKGQPRDVSTTDLYFITRLKK